MGGRRRSSGREEPRPVPLAPPPVFPSPAPTPLAGRRVFRFQWRRGGTAERSGVERRKPRGAWAAAGPAAAAATRPMAPAALGVVLAFGLQLWAAGHAVPAQVGASRAPECACPHAHPGSAGHELRPGAPRPGRGARENGGAAARPAGSDTARRWGDPFGTEEGVWGAPNSGSRGRGAATSLRQDRPGRLDIPASLPGDCRDQASRGGRRCLLWGAAPPATRGTLFR